MCNEFVDDIGLAFCRTINLLNDLHLLSVKNFRMLDRGKCGALCQICSLGHHICPQHDRAMSRLCCGPPSTSGRQLECCSLNTSRRAVMPRRLPAAAASRPRAVVALAQPRRAVGMMMAAVGAASMPSQEEGISAPKKRTRRKAQEEEPEELASSEFDFVELPKARKGSIAIPISMHVTRRRRQLADAPCLLHVHSLPIISRRCFDRSSWLALGCTPASMVSWSV